MIIILNLLMELLFLNLTSKLRKLHLFIEEDMKEEDIISLPFFKKLKC